MYFSVCQCPKISQTGSSSTAYVLFCFKRPWSFQKAAAVFTLMRNCAQSCENAHCVPGQIHTGCADTNASKWNLLFQQECSHWMKGTLKELPANLRALGLKGGPYQKQTTYPFLSPFDDFVRLLSDTDRPTILQPRFSRVQLKQSFILSKDFRFTAASLWMVGNLRINLSSVERSTRGIACEISNEHSFGCFCVCHGGHPPVRCNSFNMFQIWTKITSLIFLSFGFFSSPKKYDNNFTLTVCTHSLAYTGSFFTNPSGTAVSG